MQPATERPAAHLRTGPASNREERMALRNGLRIRWWQMLLALAIVLGVGLSVTWAFAGRLSAEPGRRISEVDTLPLAGAPTALGGDSGLAGAASGQKPCADAYQYLVPEEGAPCNGCSIAPGQHFTLDLMVSTGSSKVTAQQSYLAFDNTVVQVVDPSAGTCAPSQSVAADTTQFDNILQNEVCSGPQPCTSSGQQVAPGSISYASGTLAGCPQGCKGDIRVARVTFCAVSEGKATLRWEFAPADRATGLVASGNKQMSPASCYADYVINVTSQK